jgi:hypothetical protein
MVKAHGDGGGALPSVKPGLHFYDYYYYFLVITGGYHAFF